MSNDRSSGPHDRTHDPRSSGVSRRDVVRALAATPLVGAFTWSDAELERAVGVLGTQTPQSSPRFFTPHEWDTIRLLVDLIIPRDERSGSATDAGVPAFIDFIMMDGDNERRQTAMRGGLAWLDTACRDRFGRSFLSCNDDERAAILDDIAYPDRADPEYSHGAAFFTSLRNLTASGFWSSKMGVADLQYMGNTALPEWKGCPDEQLRNLGL